jgi:hypothetical protein
MINFRGDIKWLFQCAGKTKHATLTSAEFAREFHSNFETEPYHCEYCNTWHLGNPPKYKKKK